MRSAAAAAAAGTLRGFTATRSQQDVFSENIVKAIITANLPFSFIENEYLVKAAASVGVTLPSRKQLAGPVLDKVFEESQDFTLASLEVWHSTPSPQTSSKRVLAGCAPAPLGQTFGAVRVQLWTCFLPCQCLLPAGAASGRLRPSSCCGSLSSGTVALALDLTDPAHSP